MNWFVIKENEHLGPFGEAALKNLIDSKRLSARELIWKEGMPEPQSYEELFLKDEDQSLSDLPPELPPEVLKEARQTKEEPKQEATNFAPAEENKINEAREYREKKQPRFLTKIIFFTLFFLLTTSGVLAWILYSSNSQTFSRPSKMGVQDFKRLKKVATSKSSDGGLRFAFALSQDKSGIWMAVNTSYVGEVEVKISSIPNKTLGTEPVVVSSKGYLSERLAGFDQFVFSRGQKIIDGWHRVEVSTIGELQAPLSIAGFTIPGLGSEEKTFRRAQEVLLTNMDKRAFEKGLKRLIADQKENSYEFWKELEQKYQTIAAMARQIQKSLNQTFEPENSVNWQDQVNTFEMEYTQKYGSFFTNFVIENEKSYDQLKEQEFKDKVEVISSYTRLSRLAKQLGFETMAALTEMGELKDPHVEESREAMKKKANSRLERVLKAVREKLASIQARKG